MVDAYLPTLSVSVVCDLGGSIIMNIETRSLGEDESVRSTLMDIFPVIYSDEVFHLCLAPFLLGRSDDA